ncbi:MAG: tRNA (adenosine(37)-N6)-threonylcarbamoyltransferase complex dimerization subunit type 1 TsaB [Panacagrimonas sp.]
MRLLALDTATEACSAALWLDGQVLARFELAGRTHTQRMLPMIHELMAQAGLRFAQLDGLVCGVGPGSFAGVRIGVGFVKGLALSLDRPVVAISSLQLLAQAAMKQGASQVLTAIDARMDEVYFASFVRDQDGLAQAHTPACVLAPDRVDAPAGLGSWHAIGTGWGTYESVLRERLAVTIDGVDGAALPQAEHAFALALPGFERGDVISADALAPIYLRDKVALTLEEQQRLRASRT